MNKFLSKLFDKWLVKALCLILAVGISIICQSMTTDSQSYTVAVEAIESADFMAATPYASEIRVSARGKAGELSSLTEDDFCAYIDFNECEDAGEVNLPLRIELSERAKKLDVLTLTTKTRSIPVKVARRIIEERALDVEFSGRVAEGYAVTSYKVEPAVVKISGAKKDVDEIEAVPLKIDVGALRHDYTEYIDLHDLDVGKKCRLEWPLSVKFTVALDPISTRKTYANLPVSYANLPDGYEIARQLLPLNVELEGEQNVLDTFKFNRNIVQVDCSLIQSAGEFDLPVSLKLPNKLRLASQDEILLHVLVEEKIKEPPAEEQKPDANVEETQTPLDAQN